MFGFSRSTFLFAAMLCLRLSAVAQSTGDPAPAPQPQGEAKRHFAVSALGDWNGSPLYAKVGKDYSAIEINNLALSAEYPMPESGEIQLYREQKGPETTDYIPAIKLQTPQGIKKPLLLFLAQANAAQPQVRFYELDVSTYSGGGYRFVNLSAYPMIVSLNKEDYPLRPGAEAVATRSIQKDERVMISAAVPGAKGSPVTVFSAAMINRPTKRMTMFFVQQPGEHGQGIQCLSLVDFIGGDRHAERR